MTPLRTNGADRVEERLERRHRRDGDAQPAPAGARVARRLRALPERPQVIVVDNASTDGTADAVWDLHPSVGVIRAEANLAAAGRNLGVRQARTRFVAFSDDDSWWAPGSLARAADLLDAHRGLAVVAARVLVGPDERLDPACLALASSCLEHRHADTPGVAVLGFLACAAVARRDAFLDVGGFASRFGIGGEEELLAIDLASAGWDLAYVDGVVSHHHPSPSTDGRDGRRLQQIRNAIWVAWLRLPARAAFRRTTRLVALRDPASVAALGEAIRGYRWVLRERRIAAPEVVEAIELLDRVGSAAPDARRVASAQSA